MPVRARSGQEDTIAVRSSELAAVHAVKRRPLTRAVVIQLLEIFIGRHTPIAAPLHMGNVVLGAADVRAEVVASIGSTIAMNVCVPIVSLFLLSLAPSVIATVFLGLRGSHVK